MVEITCEHGDVDRAGGVHRCQRETPCPLHPEADLYRWLRANNIQVALLGIDRLPEEMAQSKILIALGFSRIVWSDGERDRFGPLTRIMTCLDPEGRHRMFVYG